MNSKPTKDDVLHLIHGKPTRSRVGSRAIRHRLRSYELEQLKIAEKNGFLMVDKSTREALKNAWFLLCEAKNVKFVCKEKAG